MVRIWDAESGEKLRELADPLLSVRRTASLLVSKVAFSANSRLLAAGCSSSGKRGDLLLWDTESWQLRQKVAADDGGVRCLAFSADGMLLATSGTVRQVRLWDPTTGSIRHILKGFQDFVRGLAFSPNGRTLACAYGKGVLIVDVKEAPAT